MKKTLVLMFAIVLALALPLSGCAKKDKPVVYIYNWEDYIDPAVNEMFTQETGIEVVYLKFTLNEDMYIKLKTQPSSFDVIFPSDYMIERLIREDRLAKLDFSKLPNRQSIREDLLTPSYDPTGEYSIPYLWGTVGILYNPEKVTGEIDSWSALWDENHKGQVFMLDSVRESVGLALQYAGYNPNETSTEALDKAKQLLIDQKRAGMVRAYTVDDIKDLMPAGDGALAVTWSGDAAYAQDVDDTLKYVVPKEGSNVWVDGMVIPKEAPNYENALKYIDFLSRPDIMALNTEYVCYSTPMAPELWAEHFDEDFLSHDTIFPDDSVLDRCIFYKDLGEHIETYDRLWLEIMNS